MQNSFLKNVRCWILSKRAKQYANRFLRETLRSKVKNYLSPRKLSNLMYGSDSDDEYGEYLEDISELEAAEWGEFSEQTPEEIAEFLKERKAKIRPTFTELLISHISEKKRKDPDVYRAAGLDKRLFSKIISDRNYHPGKDTAVALALALKLSLPRAKELLSSAGYVFSHSNRRDLILEFFFRKKMYSLMEINEVLYLLDEKPLGRTK